MNSFQLKSLCPIGFGTMGIGGFLSSDALSDERMVGIIRYAIENGISLIDTAEVYGSGHTEELVGLAIQGCREKVCVASKVSPENLHSQDLIRSCEASLRRLNTDYIDLYQIHWPNPSIPLAESLNAMCLLHQQGKIREIGVSNFSLKQLQEAQLACPFPGISAIQSEYNLFDRGIEIDLLPYCKANRITFLAYSPLNQGHSHSDGERNSLLLELAAKYQVTPNQISLNWLISHSNVIAIPKSTKEQHIVENVNSASFELESVDVFRIDSLFKTEIIEMDPAEIKVVQDGQGGRNAYGTLQEALANSFGFCPSPEALAREILRLGEPIKPIRVRKSRGQGEMHRFELVEGRIRYWAWVIAHEGKKPIPVLIR